jgi:hypothetical protein
LVQAVPLPQATVTVVDANTTVPQTVIISQPHQPPHAQPKPPNHHQLGLDQPEPPHAQQNAFK